MDNAKLDNRLMSAQKTRLLLDCFNEALTTFFTTGSAPSLSPESIS